MSRARPGVVKTATLNHQMSEIVNDCGDQTTEEEECWRCGCSLCGGTGVNPEYHEYPQEYHPCDCTYYRDHTTGNKCLYFDIHGDRVKPVEMVLKYRMGIPGWYMIDYVIPSWRLADDWDEEEE